MKKIRNLLLTSFCLCIGGVFSTLYAQKDPAWDNTAKQRWNPAFQVVDIPSSVDGKNQKAYVYSSKSKVKKPLIVSLHTWSGSYSQIDPLTLEILTRDWNYIHPDFRGANRNPEAGGSKLVIADIEDAIQYALKNMNADPEDVHIVGVSGGGFATLSAYMNIKYPVKSFSAWAPISDLNAWYYQSKGRKSHYANDVLKVVSRDSIFNSAEALQRSPLMQKYPSELRKNSKLFIYEGMHDGYTGSVPVSHSINMYNRLVGESKYGQSELDQLMLKARNDSDMVSEKEIIELITSRLNPNQKDYGFLFDRAIHLKKKYQNIELTLFEGTHEQIPQALGFIPVNQTKPLTLNILTLGDSNAQNKDGWVDQLKKLLPSSSIVNISKAGRTIGFDNNGKRDLNALANIDDYLNNAFIQAKGKKYDYIVLCLGTNDTKSAFAQRQNEVPVNFTKLLDKIKSHPLYKQLKTKLIYITPPPIRETNISEKYAGSNARLAQLMPVLSDIATKKDFKVIDIYHPLLGVLDYYSMDGVHMNGLGQEIIASKVVDILSNK